MRCIVRSDYALKEAIKMRMEERNWTRTQLSRMSGVPLKFISAYLKYSYDTFLIERTAKSARYITQSDLIHVARTLGIKVTLGIELL